MTLSKALDFTSYTYLYAGEAWVGERSGEERLPALGFGDVEHHPHWSGIGLNIKPNLQERYDPTIKPCMNKTYVKSLIAGKLNTEHVRVCVCAHIVHINQAADSL